MNSKTTWTRRAFLQGVGYVFVPRMVNKSIPVISASESAYVGSTATDVATKHGFSGSGIHIFDVRGNDWVCKQRIPSLAPTFLALHPHRHVLYVANQIDEYQGLPRGTIEAYRIDACEGTLAFMNRQPLSLSGVHPRHIVVSPDGTHLVAAIHGGGAYNVLSIQSDGSLGEIKQILKEVGAGPHPVYQASAHPHSVTFDRAGQYLLATDEGCDRLSVFTSSNGRLMRTVSKPCRPASGPAQILIHPSSSFVYVSNKLDGSVACYLWDARRYEMNEIQRIQIGSTDAASRGCQLTLSPSGSTLYVASSVGDISVWAIDPMTGTISLRQRLGFNNRLFLSLNWSSDRQTMFAIDGRQGEISSFPIDVKTGQLGQPSVVAQVAAPTSLLIRS